MVIDILDRRVERTMTLLDSLEGRRRGRGRMNMNLLETSITMDVHQLPVEHLAIIAVTVMLLAAVIFFTGFSIRLGEKEFNFGGMRRLLAKRDEDTLLKENLKKFADEVDHDVTANLYDLIEELEDRLEAPLTIGGHCYFTYEKFSSIVKSELYKRIRRNNLWERLSEFSRDKYINTILRDIEKRYSLLQAKANQVKCGDTYAEFGLVKEAVRGVLNKFFNGAIEILVHGMEKKIEEYEKVKPEFKTAAARKFCCDDCIAKNQIRIKRLGILG